VRLVGEKFRGGVHRHPEHVGDVLVAVFHLKRFRVVASAMTGWTRRVDAGREEEFDTYEAFALAGRTGLWGH
jgi:hypothetical protein